MKKSKLLLTLIPITTIVASTIPLTCCNEKNTTEKGNLMTEYTPDIPRYVPEAAIQSPQQVLDTYFSLVTDNPKIFEEDMLYTLSRGLPSYTSYVSDYCEVVDYNYNAEIHLDKAGIDDENKIITFTVVLDMFYDYTGTTKDELLWYDMPAKIWKAKTTAEITLDFNVYGDDFNTDNDPEVQKRQLTNLAGATQFGISERHSTMRLLAEEGYYIDPYDVRHELHQPYDTEPLHFMLPQETYWKVYSPNDEYLDRLTDTYKIWYYWFGAQIFVLIFKRYLPDNDLSSIATTPNTFDFGSYHMYNVNLQDTFAQSEDKNVCYGFNKSLGSDKNFENVKANPEYYEDDGERKTMILPKDSTILADNAFNSGLSTYTNIGIPLQINTLDIPESYSTIESLAVAGTPINVGFDTLVLHPHDGNPLHIDPYAFSQLLSLKTIDLHNFDPTYASASTINEWAHAFDYVHYGLIDQEVEGEIILPKGWKDNQSQKDAWENLLKTAGFTELCEPLTPEQDLQGWVLVEYQE